MKGGVLTSIINLLQNIRILEIFLVNINPINTLQRTPMQRALVVANEASKQRTIAAPNIKERLSAFSELVNQLLDLVVSHMVH